MVPPPLQRRGDAVYLCNGRALPLRRAVGACRLGRHLRRVLRRSGDEPLHTATLAFDEPHRVHRQRTVYPLFPHRRGHAHQRATPLPRRRHPVCGGLHSGLRHGGQGHRRLRGGILLPPAHIGWAHDVRPHLSPCSRSHSHGHGGHEHDHRQRQAPHRRGDAQRHRHHDTLHLRHLVAHHGMGVKEDRAQGARAAIRGRAR